MSIAELMHDSEELNKAVMDLSSAHSNVLMGGSNTGCN